MNQYADLVKALSVPLLVPYDAMAVYSMDIEQTANDIHRRRPKGSYDDQLTKCLIGMVCEHAAKVMLDGPDIWSRFSRQETYEDRMFDLAVIQKDKYERWQQYETLIDVKSSNKHCATHYFAFNCYDTQNNAEYEAQCSRPGANLHFFIKDSHATELLLTMDRVETEFGWLVTAKYLIHRDAFNRQFSVSGYTTSPFYYLRYNDMIRDGLCVKIPPQLK